MVYPAMVKTNSKVTNISVKTSSIFAIQTEICKMLGERLCAISGSLINVPSLKIQSVGRGNIQSDKNINLNTYVHVVLVHDVID